MSKHYPKAKNPKIIQIIKDAEKIICIDNGYSIVKDLNIIPSILIGDLDSVDLTNVDQSVEIIKHKDQNLSDLEKALNYCIEKGISKVYLLANMTEFGKSKLFNYKELEELGYNIVIYPVTTQRLAMKNVEDGLRDIYVNGHQNNIIDKMQTRKRLYELVDYEKYNNLDEKIYNFSTEGHE